MTSIKNTKGTKLKGGIEVVLFSYQAQHTLEGRPASDDKPSIPGVRDFHAYTTIAIQNAKADDPFAHQALVQLEDAIKVANEELQQRRDSSAKLLHGHSGRTTADPGISENPSTISMNVGNYAAQVLDSIGILDEIVVNILTAAHINRITQREKHKDIDAARKIIRSVFNTISRYRHTSVTRGDLVTNNELARRAIKKLVDSGFIDLSLYDKKDDYKDLRDYYANYDVELDYVDLHQSAQNASTEDVDASEDVGSGVKKSELAAKAKAALSS